MNYFGYLLPAHQADTYAKHALVLLQKIRISCPKVLMHMMRSDVVLTLSGVRALNSGLVFEHVPAHELEVLQKLLQANGIAMFNTSIPHFVKSDGSWNLIHAQAFRRLPHDYQILNEASQIDYNFVPDSAQELAMWSYTIESFLCSSMNDQLLPYGWQQSAQTPRDVRIGCLLGYPGDALAALAEDNVIALSGEPSTLLDANIAYGDMHTDDAVDYLFLDRSTQVVSHEMLWSQILTNIYESNWYRSLISW